MKKEIIGIFLMMVSAVFAQNPNIIYVLADDLGYGDLGCIGQKILFYDLLKDVDEQNDLAVEFPEAVDRICQAMNESHMPSPYGDKSFPEKFFSANTARAVPSVGKTKTQSK